MKKLLLILSMMFVIIIVWGQDDESPDHIKNLRSYYLGKNEDTQKEYWLMMVGLPSDRLGYDELKELAEQGVAEWQTELGYLYFEGDVVEQDYGQASMWFFLAATQGYSLAQHLLGMMYANGFGYEQDYQKAADWIRLAAEQGDVDAQLNLGSMYLYGKGVPVDYVEAVKWTRLAAEQDYSEAQYNLGVMYRDGIGLIKDYVQAVKWFHLASEQGNAKATYNLGVLYETGKGILQNSEEAIKLYRLSANLGDAIAQYTLGKLYASGKYVEQDYQEAAKFYLLSAQQGYKLSELTLRVMYESNQIPYRMLEILYGYDIVEDEDLPEIEGMILVKGGAFDVTDDYNVTLSSYYIGQYEVTQSEYQSVMGNNPSHFTGNPNRPVDSVSWFDAIEYCNRLSLSEGLTPVYRYGMNDTNPDDWQSNWNKKHTKHRNIFFNRRANGYRLPTEMEWEFAARGGVHHSNYRFSGSDNYDEVAWIYDNSGQTTHPVGTKSPNELGIFDMSGNVFEWCWDIYGDYQSGKYFDPKGTLLGEQRVLRGGSYSGDYRASLTYRRDSYPASFERIAVMNVREINIGFRVVRNAE